MSGTGMDGSVAGATTPAGVTAPGAAAGRGGFLSDVIVELGFATQETVEQAVRAARSPGTTVARVLVDMNAISEAQLARATAERYGLDYIELEGFEVDPGAANLITPAAAQRYGAVPVAFLGEVLLVAMGDPADSVGITEISALTSRRVRPAVASRPALHTLLAALPRDELQPAPPPAPAAAAAPPPEAPAPPPAAPDANSSELREELDALKRQLSGAEAQLEGAGAQDELGPGGPPDRPVLEARLADAEAELEDARVRVREAKEVSAELETLRGALSAAEAGLEARARGEGATQPQGDPPAGEHVRRMASELRRLRAEVDVRRGEFEALRGRLADTEVELVRARAEIDIRASELRALRARVESAEADARGPA